MALLANLIWTCGQLVLFYNIFGCFCLHCECAQIIIILIFSLTTDLQFTIFQISDSNTGINELSIIKPNIEHLFFYPISHGSVPLISIYHYWYYHDQYCNGCRLCIRFMFCIYNCEQLDLTCLQSLLTLDCR